MIPEGAHRGTNGLTPRGFHADARGERTSLAPEAQRGARPWGARPGQTSTPVRLKLWSAGRAYS